MGYCPQGHKESDMTERLSTAHILLTTAIAAEKAFNIHQLSIESSCKAGHPGSTAGLGRSPGEGIGYPLQYSWASLGAHTVKN